MNQSRKWLLVVFVLAALLRLLVFAIVYPDETRFRQPDSGGYDRPAVNLVHLIAEYTGFKGRFKAKTPF